MANVLKDVEKTHLQHDNMTDPMFLTVAGKVSERLDAFDKLEEWFKVLEQAQKKLTQCMQMQSKGFVSSKVGVALIVKPFSATWPRFTRIAKTSFALSVGSSVNCDSCL